MEDREQTAVDALFAEALGAGESRPRARGVLSRALDEQVLASALRRAVPVAFLEEVASARPWSERPRVLARVVLSPRAPQALALRLVSGLYWRDLAEVAATTRVPAAVRSRAESLLRDGLGDMRLGDRVTLARLATPALLPGLLADSERQVAEAALLNPRLREEDLVAASAAKGERLRALLVERLGDHPHVGDVRGRGLMVGLEIVADRATTAPFPRAERRTEAIVAAAREAGVLVYSGTGAANGVDGDTILLGPPFVVTDDEMVRIADGVAAAVAAATPAGAE